MLALELSEDNPSTDKESKTWKSSGRQSQFREILAKRDTCCVITGSTTFEACYIVPHYFYQHFEAIGRTGFEGSAINEEMMSTTYEMDFY